MSNDSRFVLAQLTRTGIWSSWCNLSNYKHLVLEADSVLTFLYQHCLNKHIRRQRSLAARQTKTGQAPQPIDYYTSTLVNYQELARLYEQLLDYFAQNAIRLVIVYRGKHMEAPLFGLMPAQFKKNTQRASETLIALIDYEQNSEPTPTSGHDNTKPHHSHKEHKVTLDRMRPTRPNLALNLFKQIVSQRRATRKQDTKVAIECHQAFYCPYPACARLARDLKCPVMTNDGDFVVMDVRAGFILFEEFFTAQLATSNLISHQQSSNSTLGNNLPTGSNASTTSLARNQLAFGPDGRGIDQASRSASLFEAATASKATNQAAIRRSISASQLSMAHRQTSSSRISKQVSIKLRFHFNRQFLLQHPGLNPALALQLFPLTSGEFIVQYAKSLVRLRIYEREFQEKDLIVTSAQQNSFKKYHMAAARLELVLRYLCAKDSDVVPNLMRGEASRLANSLIERDYQELYNYYAVSYHFKGRLALILGFDKSNLSVQRQANHLENCLLARECTADFWLNLVCCALAKLASVDYNKSMQFEDLQTKHSAHSMLDRPKSVMINLLSGEDKRFKSAQSPALSSEQRKQLAKRFPTASITVIDREGRQLVERQLDGQSTKISQLKQDLRARVSLSDIAKANRDLSKNQSSSSSLSSPFKSDVAIVLNEMFNSHDITKLMEQTKNCSTSAGNVLKWLAADQQKHLDRFRVQLATMLTLHKFSLNQALQDDQYFKQHYLNLTRHFETGLINACLYLINQTEPEMGPASGNKNNAPIGVELRQVVDLVNRFDLENVINYKGLMTAANQIKAKQQTSAKTINAIKSQISQHEPEIASASVTKQIRHLIELLSSSIEAYCEVNAFLNYPLPQLQLQNYNPILLFNMILFSFCLSKSNPPTSKSSSSSSLSSSTERTNKKTKK